MNIIILLWFCKGYLCELWLEYFFEKFEGALCFVKALFTMVLRNFDDKKNSGKKVAGYRNFSVVIYRNDTGERRICMHDMAIQSVELESKVARAQAELAKFAEEAPKEDLLKQMGETLVAQVDQMSQMALRLLGG